MRKGSSHTERWKKEHADKLIGRFQGKDSPHFGRNLSDLRRKRIVKAMVARKYHHTEEHRIKVSEMMSGSKSPLYVHGHSKETKLARATLKFRLWREKVFKRDNYTCQKCGKQGVFLHPHHIKNFSVFVLLRFIVSNGITFCKKCHNLFHSIYGRKDNTLEQVQEFIGGV